MTISVRGAARDLVRGAFEAAIEAAAPDLAVRRACRVEGNRLELPGGVHVERGDGSAVWLVGAGKATPRMAAEAAELLGPRIRGGSITTRGGLALPVPGQVEVWEAAHPVPDVRAMAAASDALRLVRSASPDELVLCLLSGGASALWTAPVAGVSLSDLQAITQLLLRSGASIDELNAVRKHLSRIAGGQLAMASRAGRLVTLAISDVIGDRPDVIGSGPTVPDPTTYADALAVLDRYGIDAPGSVLLHLRAGAAGEIPETPDVGHPVWERTSYSVVASLADALAGAEAFLASIGYRVEVSDQRVTGEAREAGAAIARVALAAAGSERSEPLALLWGGEATVTVRGSGTGGRNQEMALAAAIELAGASNITVGCLATDGIDGPTDAAGAIIDGLTVEKAVGLGLDPSRALRDNDSYPLLCATGDLVVSGPTGTNVNDVAIVLIGSTGV